MITLFLLIFSSVVSDVLDNVNSQISSRSHSRLFSVIRFASNQYKVTEGDLLVVETNPYFADVGERICLEKVGIRQYLNSTYTCNLSL